MYDDLRYSIQSLENKAVKLKGREKVEQQRIFFQTL